MKIISYNVNGIRAAIRKGLIDWIGENDFDVICIQETKARPEQVNLKPLEEMGYDHFWHSAEKKGYSGVVTITRSKPKQVVEGMGVSDYDREGRILRTDFDEVTVLNCYFPSGTTGDVRQTVKYAFLDDFKAWVKGLQKEQPNLIVVGDYNIAHTEMDIHNPVGNKKNSGFLPEEREWMTRWFENGFVDAFRYKYPEDEVYSWWTYRHQARKQNKGWRIDYQSVTDNLKDNIVDAGMLTDVVHSDHCPVFMEIDL